MHSFRHVGHADFGAAPPNKLLTDPGDLDDLLCTLPDDLAQLTRPDSGARVKIDPERLEKDLAKLVLTLVELIRRLMEGQTINRMERGQLNDDQVERLGSALMAAKDKIEELRVVFGIENEDLNIDLGPLGSVL